LKQNLSHIVKRALDLAVKKGDLSGDLPAPIIEMTRERKFGDYATNIAMVIASKQGSNPRDLAVVLVQLIGDADTDGIISDVSVAGPGFINITMSPGFWSRILRLVLEEGESFACSDIGEGKRVQVEFVSANPTGPLHVGHGRGAALGDALANILDCAGYSVGREYYINDGGNQIRTLGLSVHARYLEFFGRNAEFPEEGYRGNYIRELAERLADEQGDIYLNMVEEKAVEEMAVRSAAAILDDIRDDLEEFGVLFDMWFSEKELLDRGEVGKALEDMENRGHSYWHENALWFRSTDKGDDKDRVLVKSDGSLTYFASDVAYHRDKFERGFDTVVNIWGADHHGYVARMKAAVQGLGRKLGIKPEQSTFINYWFRHLWEFSMPTYPTIIITSVMVGVSLFTVVKILAPMTAISILCGGLISFLILRKKSYQTKGNSPARIIVKFLQAAWPILLLVPTILAGIA